MTAVAYFPISANDGNPRRRCLQARCLHQSEQCLCLSTAQ